MSQSFDEQRLRMVDEQLLPRGIQDRRVLRAMAEVPRDRFMPDELRHASYDDFAHSIGQGQTISQPYTVAFMCELAQLRGDERVLEVGTGSGYGAAVLSRLAAHVVTVERIAELADAAAKRVAGCGYENITVVVGDGSAGCREAGPFDAIVVTAGGPALPPNYVAQLTPSGRIVMPIRSADGGQVMHRFTRDGDQLRTETFGEFAFVPLVGRFGEHDREAE